MGGGQSPAQRVSGPELQDDGSVTFKTFDFRPTVHVQVRAEAFNIFESVDLMRPVGNLSSATFGKSTQSFPSREVQFALKVHLLTQCGGMFNSSDLPPQFFCSSHVDSPSPNRRRIRSSCSPSTPLRTDHVRASLTPTLDALEHEAVTFNQAITVAPLTLPAHASLLSGLYPPRHQIRDNEASPFLPQSSRSPLDSRIAATPPRRSSAPSSWITDMG